MLYVHIFPFVKGQDPILYFNGRRQSLLQVGSISRCPRVAGFCACSRLDKACCSLLWYVPASCCLYPASSSRRACFITSTAFPLETGTLGSLGSTVSPPFAWLTLLPKNTSSSALISAYFSATTVRPNTRRSFHSCIHIRASSFLRGLSDSFCCARLLIRCHRCARHVKRRCPRGKVESGRKSLQTVQ